MKEYMPKCNRLAGSAKLADELLIYENNPIHMSIGMIFASTNNLLKILIKNIKEHFNNL